MVQGTLKSLLQHQSSKASILQLSACFIVQLSHPYMTTGKTIALTRQTFVGKVMSLLFNMLSMLVITFLPRSKHLLISWLLSLLPETTKNMQNMWEKIYKTLHIRQRRTLISERRGENETYNSSAILIWETFEVAEQREGTHTETGKLLSIRRQWKFWGE